MSKEEVEAVEGRPVDIDATRLCFSPRDVGGHKSSIIYLFQDEKLVVVKIQLFENPRHTEEYDAAGKDWVALLRDKYGQGNGKVTPEGDTITAYFDWNTPRSEISLKRVCKVPTWKGNKNTLYILAVDPVYFQVSYDAERKEF